MSINTEQQFAQAESHLMQGRFTQALTTFSPLAAIYKQNPQYFKAVATCYFGLKEYQQAVNAFEQAYQLDPNDASLLSGYGTALYQNRQIQDAVDKFCVALNLQPESIDTRIKLIALLKECDHIQQALVVLRDGLKHTPNDTTLNQLKIELSGVVSSIEPPPTQQKPLSNNQQLEQLWQNRKLDQLLEAAIEQLNQELTTETADELIVYLNKVSEVQPFWWQIWLTKAMCLHKTNRVKQSLAFYRQALEIDNTQYDLLLNAAVAFNSQFEFKAGQYCLDRMQYLGFALPIKALTSLGFSLLETGQYDKALNAYQTALAKKPDENSAAFSISLIHLTQGDFLKGWQAYRLRLPNISQYNRALKHNIPVWQGESLSEKTLAIVYEQGHGDTIQFMRFIPQLCQQAKRVIFQVNPLIANLIEHFVRDVPNIDIITSNVNTGDYLVSLMELGQILSLDQHKIARSCSTYLDAPQAKINQWQKRFNQTDKIKIGIAWSGNPDNKRDLIRSISFENIAPLLALNGVQFYSLQIDNAIPAPFDEFIIDLSAEINDFTDTAAIIQHLDLVISVDTGVAHLAAAMGKPVWMMISYVPDWRWLLDRNDSIWYPSVTLYRQTQNQHWQPVIKQLHDDLISRFNIQSTTEHHLSLLLSQQHHRYALTQIHNHEMSQADLTTEMYYQKVQALVGTNQHEAALELALQITQATIPKAHNVYYQGVVATQTHDYKQSFDWLAQAFALMPTNIDWLLNLTKCATKLGRTGFALELIAIAEKSVGYHHQLILQKAYVHMCNHELDQAEIVLQKGLIQDPQFQGYQFALSQLHLFQQNFTTAWRWFEQRPIDKKTAQIKNNAILPEWRGNKVQTAEHKKCLFVYGEQGIGDQIMCLRYLPLLLTYFDKINLHIHASLPTLIKNSLSPAHQQQVNFVTGETIPADADFCISLYSLPYKLQNNWHYSNFGQAYLTSKPTHKRQISQWVTTNQNKLKIGLVWQGSKQHERDDERSISLENFLPILDLEACAFCSLQIDNHDLTQQKTNHAMGKIADFSAGIQNMNDTASLINQLDLVISIDSAVAHLAGALGVPCWLLVSYLPNPRWLITGEKSNWYNSITLFRQPQIGDWEAVIKQVAQQLKTTKLAVQN
ncbi:tetratricopeptide repeat protein [Algibacillus agarilyticus]|uniref:tetratricopeptide repeat protein n=1 Tax=Algibacillus agarilyticus TaxID=2234133 RepID=UPI000DD04895|nr:tetratricopeptide repeat protein [Algibacillus agarilyticus]